VERDRVDVDVKKFRDLPKLMSIISWTSPGRDGALVAALPLYSQNYLIYSP